jgi:NAD(P)-dependent dehydrogenase (short-subunit alcohol dehydrogenase family)
MVTLDGKRALVTGGAGGIGLACAQHLVADGASVLLMGRTKRALEVARATILRTQPNSAVEVFQGDAALTIDVQSAVEIMGDIDIVVSTVGGSLFRPLLEHDARSFFQQIQENLVPAFIAVRTAVPAMRRGGSIVCISSNVAKINFRNLSAYATAKSALEGFVRSAADELGVLGIRVNAVRPGLVRVDRTSRIAESAFALAAYAVETPLSSDDKACAEPGDIAAAVRYLAGPEASWVTGQSFAIDGGQELRGNPDPSALFPG